MAVKAYTQIINTQDTTYDGSVNAPILVTGVTNGTIIDEITINAIQTTTAGFIRMFIYDGTSTRLHTQIPVSAVTVSPTTQSWNTVIRPLNLKLAHNQQIRFTTTTGDDFHLTASVTEL
jgi:hypothetical protein